MVPKDPPKNIIPFDKLNFYTKEEIEESYICFYCADSSFKKISINPRQYLKMFRRCKGIIGFDLSVYTDMPKWKQKEMIGKNLSLDFFFGLRHYPIIPNIRWGSEDLHTDYLSAIPKHAIVAVGTYGFIKTNEERKTWKEFIMVLCNELEPSGIVAYGSCPDSVFNHCDTINVPIYKYESFKSKRMKEIR